MYDHHANIAITGIQAAGKSTVARLLAERFPRLTRLCLPGRSFFAGG